MIDQLNAICQQAMRRPIAPDDDLIKSGLTTNRALKIIKAFWIDSGIELDVNIFYRHRTVRAIVEAIDLGLSATFEKKIFTLRDGDRSTPLFVYAGGVNYFLEMQEMISALDFKGIIYAIGLTDFNRPANDPPSVEDEVRVAYAAIKAVHPEGPYRLAGFSFGGVLALELARKMTAEGDEAALVFMIDSPQNDHSWPWKDWAGVMLKIVSAQVQRKIRVRERRQALREEPVPSTGGADRRPRFNHEILFRFRNPRNPRYPIYAPQWAGGYTPRYGKAAKQLLQMKGLFRPKAYDDKVVFVRSKGGSAGDVDSKIMWQRYLPKAEWIDTPGNHLSMMMGRNARVLANYLDEKLETAADSPIARLRSLARQSKSDRSTGRPVNDGTDASDIEPTTAASSASKRGGATQ